MSKPPLNRTTFGILMAALTACAVLFELGFSALTRDGLSFEQRAIPGKGAGTFELRLDQSDASGDWYYTLARDSYIEVDDLGGVPVQAISLQLTRQPHDRTQGIIRFYGVVNGIAGEYMVGIVMEEGVYRARLNAQSVDWIRIFPTELLNTSILYSGMVLNDRVETDGFTPARCLLWIFLLAALFLGGNVLSKRLFQRYVPLGGWTSAYFLFGMLVVGAAYLATRMYSGMRALGAWVLVAAALLYTVSYLVIWLFVQKIQKPEMKLAVAALSVGMLFSMASAPLQAPDETIHFLRAYSISRGQLDFDYKEIYPDDVYILLNTFPGHYNETVLETDYSSVVADIRQFFLHADDAYYGNRSATKIQVVLPYVPAALGIAICRLLGANALICMYAGRLANVVMLAICAYFALKYAVRYRGALVAVTLLPMTLYMASSLSYDAMFLSAFVLFLGGVLKSSFGRKDLILLCCLVAVMLSIKPVYCPLALMLLLVPKDEYKLPFRRGIAVLILLGCGAALYALTMAYAAWFGTSIPLSENLIGVDVSAQIQYVLHNPLRYLMVMAVDGYGQAFYMGQFGMFGWLDAPAVMTGLITPMVLIAVGALYADEQRKQKNTTLWLLASLIVSVYVVVVTGFYASWSTLGGTSILGVQARYLIPIVPPLILLISAAFSPVIRFRETVSDRTLMRDKICVHLCAAFAALSALELAMIYFVM